MARTKNLRNSVVNQFIDDLSNGHIVSPLPSQSILANMYNTSRTTIRHSLEHLHSCGILEKVGNDYVIVRQPVVEDYYDTVTELPHEQAATFERAFYKMIHQRELSPGDTFTELQLARFVNISPVVVREFLLRFSRYNLIENIRRGQWHMKKFDQHYAEKLFELRELLETQALTHFMNLPEHDQRWVLAKELLYRHRQLRKTVIFNYRAFSQLDHELHSLLLSAADNPFFNQSMEAITVIFHFHYQRDEADLKARNILAIEEHMAILNAMLNHDDLSAMNELHRHLETAKSSMVRAITQQS
ncbi:GntR family transcriptional regulator [Buttiauxella brennerae]|uniref:GntR family transcriptional regulator n=1 Tax=Buttiauxella brennerae TaxID=82988 RepID=UPI00286F3265|nr:GntR family transcriptional regulator [Buttiauxella brennerae]